MSGCPNPMCQFGRVRVKTGAMTSNYVKCAYCSDWGDPDQPDLGEPIEIPLPPENQTSDEVAS